MKALQILEPGRAAIVDIPAPKPKPNEALVQIEAVTTCPHWDMHILGGQPMFAGGALDYPYTVGQPGHEAVGRVVATGSKVTTVSEGQRVCVWRDRGHDVQGCYAEYVAADEAVLIPAPEGLPSEALAPLELAMCVSVHILFAEKLAALRGKRVGVFGLGPAGLVCVQLARAGGAADVLAFDPLPQRRALASGFGAACALDPTDPKAMAQVPPRNANGALDACFDCAGTVGAVRAAMAITRELVVLFAVQREPYTFLPEYWGGLVLAGAQPHTREGAERAMTHIRNGELDLRTLVTHTLPLSEYSRAVALLKNQEALKIALVPGDVVQ